MKELMVEGKIKAWELSNAPIDYMNRAHGVCLIAAIENQYSMMWREPEKELFSICEELGISFVAYSPLGNGFLAENIQKIQNMKKVTLEVSWENSNLKLLIITKRY
jgi:aryl-alcohol dehydrogenase-like predicted oxidoreductase